MVGEMSICPINWDEYYEKVEKALDIIHRRWRETDTVEELEELLRVDTISGYPQPICSWNDTKDNIDGICPANASVAEVDWLREQVEKLAKGKAL
jgi:hypothetical protein